MKKAVLFILALWLTSSSLWAYDFEVDNLCYNITDASTKQVEVAKCSVNYSGDIIIPAWVTYNETSYSVISIATSAFKNCTGLTSITIPESVISIGNSAFNGCTSLSSVTIPNTITSIGSSAFSGCTGLTEVTLSNRITSIPTEAFLGCQQLTAITIPERVTSIESQAFKGCGSLTSLTIPNSVTSIGQGAFYDCAGLTEVSLSNQITSIPTEAFLGCWHLTSITIPNSVYSIGQWAFEGCTSLTSVTIGKRVSNIAAYSYYGAFLNCHSLKEFIVDDENETYSSVDGLLCNKAGTTLISYPNSKSVNSNYTLPNSITTIADYAFCWGFTYFSLTIPNSVTEIGRSAFYGCEGLTSIVIGDNVSTIGVGVFQGCTHLKEVVIGNSLQSIPEKAFYGCQSLSSITIPNNITSIGDNAFEGCLGLKEMTIGNGVTSIGSSAFLNCTNLTSVSIGSSVTVIESSVFSGCGNLKAIYCQNTTPPTIEENSFDQLAINTVILYVPVGTLSAYENADVWWQFLNKKELTSGKAVLTLSSEDDTMGTVTGGGEYDNGAVVTIKAEYNKGYRFVQWSDGNSENPRNIVMTDDITLSAMFSAISYNSNGVALTTCGTDWGNSTSDRKLTNLALYAGIDTTEINITTNGSYHTIYHDYTNQVFTAEKGSTIHIKVNSNDSIWWSHGYVYIDCDNDGEFAVDINTNNGLVNTGSELLSYSYYGINDDSEERGFDSTGKEHIGRGSNRSESILSNDRIPAFTLPDLVEGNYRMRFKVDWNCLDACGNDSPNQLITENGGYIIDFTLTVTDSTSVKLDLLSNNAQWGTVTGGGIYEKEDTVTIEAIPAEGYQFVQWSDGVTDNPRSLCLTQDLALTAEFAAIPCQLMVQSNNDAMGRVIGNGIYDKNETVTIEAIPAEGYDFVRWGDGSYENPRTITINRDTVFTALFQEQYHQLGLFVNNEALGSVTLNRVAIIEAIPAEGATFVGWSDGNSENPRMVYLNQDISLTAQFAVGSSIENVDGIVIKIYAVDGAICIDDAPAGETITVNDLSGRTVKVEETTEGITRIILEESGIYLVRVGNCIAKVIL